MIGAIGVQYKAEICEWRGLWVVRCGMQEEAGLANAHSQSEQTVVHGQALMRAVRTHNLQLTTHNRSRADSR